MLQADARAFDLALVGLAAELPHELGALSEARRAERMALREQAAGRVRHPLAAVGVVAVLDELLGFALAGEPERLVREDLVRREAVVELDDVDVLRAEARLLIDGIRGRCSASPLDFKMGQSEVLPSGDRFGG